MGDLLERLSPVVLDVVAAPMGLDRSVCSVTIIGPGDDLKIGPDDIVLAMCTPDALGTLIERAGQVGAALVATKTDSTSRTALRGLSETHRVAIAAVARDADWGQVFTLLRTITESLDTHGLDDQPGDLFALANAIAAATGGATTIEDRDLRVVAYSNLEQPIDDVRRDSILGRTVPGYVIERQDITAVYEQMWRDTEVVHLPARDAPLVRSRMGAAIRAGDEVIGTVWVVEGDHPFEDGAERALLSAIPHAALLLLRHRAASNRERRRRGDAVLAAIRDGRSPFELVEGEQVRAVVFGLREHDAPSRAALVVRYERLLDLAAFQLELFDPRAAAAIVDDTVVALVPEPMSGSSGRLRSVLTTITTRAMHALKTEVVAGIGSGGTKPAEISHSHWEADRTRRLLMERSTAAVAFINEVHSAVVMERLREVIATDARCHTHRLDALRDHDEQHRTDHLVTLGSYLDAFGDVAAAAESLNIHPNTLRYRLRKIWAILGTDISDPVDRFVLELEWRTR